MQPDQATATPTKSIPDPTAIAALNDRARNNDLANARIVFTANLMAHLTRNAVTDLERASARLFGQQSVLNKVRKATFDTDNDPHGEHDFGSLEHDEAKIFWKIDVYENDGSFQWGAEDPANPDTSYRVITIMLASDY